MKNDILMNDNLFITHEEVEELMGIGESTAYKVVQELNKELKSMGYMTVAGKVSKNYFIEKVLYGVKPNNVA